MRRCASFTCGLLFVALLVAAVADPALAAGPKRGKAKAKDDLIVVPGVRAGLFELGKPIPAAAFEAHGQPDIVNPPDPGTPDSGNVTWDGFINVKTHDGKDPGNVFQIFLEKRGFKTEKGIGIGSREKALRQAYPDAVKSDDTAGDFEYSWKIPGLTFYMVRRKVSGLGVHPLRDEAPPAPAPDAGTPAPVKP